jgi:hypothetical protein
MARTLSPNAAAKRLDKEIERIFYATCSGITIPVLDIPKIFVAGRAAAAAGTSIEAAVVGAVAVYRVNPNLPRF